MASKKTPKKLEGLIAEAVKRLALAKEASSDNRERAKAAILFRDLEQWPKEIKDARENDPDGARPCLTLDKINQYVNQVKNDERQNRPSIKVRPVDDAGDVKVAEIYQGLIRDIEDCSSADNAYDTAFEHAADGGFGYFRVVTEYTDEMSFDLVPRIKRISNRFSVELDPHFQEADGSDRKWGFIFETIPKDEFERKYPRAEKVSFDDYGEAAPDWCGESVTVAEYFRLEEEEVEIALLPDGTVVEMEDVPEGVTPEDTRKTTKAVCKWSKLTCAEELDSRDFPCKYVPIVEVVGNELDLEGKRRLSGLVRGAMDSMRMYNYGASSFVENVALAPKVPYVGAEGQFEGREDEWSQANRRNISALTYKPVVEGGVLVPPPRREQMVGVPMGWQQVMQNMEHDVQTSMGMYASNLGEQTQATSGKQELALQKRGDTGTFHYVDNLTRAIRFCGRILIDIIPRVMDQARLTRILLEDGKTDQVRLDPEQEEAVKTITGQDGKSVNYYNLNKGKYDVVVSAGPSYTTKRLEAAEFMTNAMTAAKDPVTAQVLTYLAIKSSDVAGAEEATKMLKKLLPPQLQEVPEDVNLPPEVADALGQAKAQLDQREQMLMQKEQGLAEVGQVAEQETQKAKDARAEVEKEQLRIQSERNSLSADRSILKLTEQLVQAQAEAHDAQQQATIDGALTSVRDLISKHELAVSKMLQGQKDQQAAEGEAQESQQSTDAIMQSHQALMQQIAAVLQAIVAPKVKRSQAVGPSGMQYDITTTEEPA